MLPTSFRCLSTLNQIGLSDKVRKHRTKRSPFTQMRSMISELWVAFLAQARDGNLNEQITIRQPTKICWSDSCWDRRLLTLWKPGGSEFETQVPSAGLDTANNDLEFPRDGWVTVSGSS
jgi:hypothetical protein